MIATKRKKAATRVKAREHLRVQLSLWLAEANHTLTELLRDAQLMADDFKNADSPLKEFLTLDEAAGIMSALEDAVSHVSSVVVPTGGRPPRDVMAAVDAARE